LGIKNLIKKAKHPYLVKRAINRRMEDRNSKKHMKRLNEYDDFVASFEDTLFLITGNKIVCKQILDTIKTSESKKFFEHLCTCRNNCQDYCFMPDYNTKTLFAVALAAKPNLIIETGVANGYSSASFLKALAINKSGTLHSIDLHARGGVTIPEDKSLGWVIPENLRNNWNLHLGSSDQLLVPLLQKHGPIDIFMHDSRHLYKTQMFEYKAAYPHIKHGGLLISDDATDNDAFLDFAEMQGLKPIIINGDYKLGLLIKP
jgi:hypothetical protein